MLSCRRGLRRRRVEAPRQPACGRTSSRGSCPAERARLASELRPAGSCVVENDGLHIRLTAAVRADVGRRRARRGGPAAPDQRHHLVGRGERGGVPGGARPPVDRRPAGVRLAPGLQRRAAAVPAPARPLRRAAQGDGVLEEAERRARARRPAGVVHRDAARGGAARGGARAARLPRRALGRADVVLALDRRGDGARLVGRGGAPALRPVERRRRRPQGQAVGGELGDGRRRRLGRGGGAARQPRPRQVPALAHRRRGRRRQARRRPGPGDVLRRDVRRRRRAILRERNSYRRAQFSAAQF